MDFHLNTPLACNLLAVSDVLPWRLLENKLTQIWLFLLAIKLRFSRFREWKERKFLTAKPFLAITCTPALSHSIFSADWLWDFIPASTLQFYKTPRNCLYQCSVTNNVMFSDRLTTQTNRPMKGSFAAKTGHPRTQKTDATSKFSVCASSPSRKASRVFPR